MITYTPEQVLENIKAIVECREEDINLPLAVLKREMPKELKDALNTTYRRNIDNQKDIKNIKRNIVNQKNIKNI
jgi:hypothetical protein